MRRIAFLTLALAGLVVFGLCLRSPRGLAQAAGGRPLRIALIRVDEHAWWFGGFFNDYDEARLEKNHPRSAQRNRTIKDVKIPLPGVRIVKVWDRDPAKAQEFARTYHIPVVAARVEEMAEGVDGVLLVDAVGDGSDHLRLVRPFLEKGIPAFVDKPFADTTANAEAIAELARKYSAPVYTSSTLPHILMKRWGEKLTGAGRVTSAITGGPIAQNGGPIHSVIANYSLLGPGPVSVQNIGDATRDVVQIRYADGRLGIVYATDEFRRSPQPQFYGMALAEKDTLISGPIEPMDFQYGASIFLRNFVEMVRTKKAPLPYEQLVEQIRITEAARISKQRGGTVVPLSEIR